MHLVFKDTLNHLNTLVFSNIMYPVEEVLKEMEI